MTTRFEHGVGLSARAANLCARVLRVSHDDAGRAAAGLLALDVRPGAEIAVLQTFRGVISECDQTEVAVEPDLVHAIRIEAL